MVASWVVMLLDAVVNGLGGIAISGECADRLHEDVAKC